MEARSRMSRAWIASLLVLCAAAAAHGPSLGNGFVNLDARNYSTPGYTYTGIYNALPSSGLTPVDFVVGEDDTGQTLIQQTVRASIQVLQRRSLAR